VAVEWATCTKPCPLCREHSPVEGHPSAGDFFIANGLKSRHSSSGLFSLLPVFPPAKKLLDNPSALVYIGNQRYDTSFHGAIRTFSFALVETEKT
jgi:hypothetical protein